MSVGERRCLAAYRLRKVRHALKDMIIAAHCRAHSAPRILQRSLFLWHLYHSLYYRAYIAALKALRDVVDWLGSRLAPECYWPDPDWHWLHS